ncbi:MAG: ABC transporter permease subunit [Candidatus Muiribacteriaceae bacterium]
MEKKKTALLSPIIRKRLKKFTTIKRGYYSFLIILAVYVLSFFSEFLINGNALMVKYDGELYFTAYSSVQLKKNVNEKSRKARMDYFGAVKYSDFNESQMSELKSKRILAENRYNQYRVLKVISDDEFDTLYATQDGMLSRLEFAEKVNTVSQQELNKLRRTFERAEENYNTALEFRDATPEKIASLKTDYEEIKKVKEYVSKSHRRLSELFNDSENDNWAIMAPYSYGPNESLLDELDTNPPTPPDSKHWVGTDDRGRDVLARLVYGFRISMSFALLVVVAGYTLGVIVGALVGFFGGKFDFITMRFIEIWSSMPFLFTVMIIASIMVPNFLLLVIILSLWGWIGTAWYIRAEFLREKNRDYVQAAQAIGVSNTKIIFRHILPNSLTPLISFLPFSIISGIGSLVSLDFLGFGLPAPTPSWGELLNQGIGNINSWWIAIAPIGAMFLTLMLVTFIGEAVREAFDPKVYSRLR